MGSEDSNTGYKDVLLCKFNDLSVVIVNIKFYIKGIV